MAAVSRHEQERWLARVDDLRCSIRSLLAEAREGNHDPVPEAVFDMLGELRAELREDFRSSRWSVSGKTLRAFHPFVRPAAALAEKSLQRAASLSAWTAAGFRLRLKQVG